MAVLSLIMGCKRDKPNQQPTSDNQNIQLDYPTPDKYYINTVDIKLAYIPPGEFMMGSPTTELARSEVEGPQHLVRITHGFYISTTEITQSQYSEIMIENPSRFIGQNNPVERVLWNEAVEFCKKLSKKEGRIYRLPTEAEWEYVCRADTTTPFHTGQTISTDQANFHGEIVYGDNPKGINRNNTLPVGSFSPNDFGIYDMHGNVWEWCNDWFDDNYYDKSPTSDPQGPSSGKNHVLRGGSYFFAARPCRSAFRLKYDPIMGKVSFGFRIVLEMN